MMLFPVMRTNNNWLDNAFNDFFSDAALSKMNSTAPAVNVKDTEKAYVMEVAVPGIKKEFCRVNIDDNGNLEIAIENKLEHKEERKKEHYLRREFSYSNYQQSYVLPDDVDRDKISAKVTDGVLEINLPKVVKEVQKVQRSIDVL
jgi:small heat shock protein C2